MGLGVGVRGGGLVARQEVARESISISGGELHPTAQAPLEQPPHHRLLLRHLVRVGVRRRLRLRLGRRLRLRLRLGLGLGLRLRLRLRLRRRLGLGLRLRLRALGCSSLTGAPAACSLATSRAARAASRGSASTIRGLGAKPGRRVCSCSPWTCSAWRRWRWRWRWRWSWSWSWRWSWRWRWRQMNRSIQIGDDEDYW